MSHSALPLVIVGAGLAGANVAIALRAEGYTGRVLLIGEEGVPPYERPALSKGYLGGASSAADIASRPVEAYDEAGVETRFGEAAAALDLAGHAVVLAGGERVSYDRLVLATGARNRRPPLPGLDLGAVHDLRTLADADALRVAARPGARAVVLGTGFVGTEVAASLRGLGLEVTAVDLLDGPLLHALGPELSDVVRAVHEEHGVRMVLGERVVSLDGDDRVRSVRLAGGEELPCDLVFFGFGALPRAELAAAAGLEVADGIVVDEHGRTSDPHVFAVGDVASHLHPVLGRHVRVEHWQHAVLQARAVARTLAGTPTAYSDVHWFWSDQYDLHLHYAGFHEPWDSSVVRGNVEDRRFAVFHLSGGRLVSTAAVGMPLVVRQSMPLIAARAVVDPDGLADPDVRLPTLLTGAGGQ